MAVPSRLEAFRRVDGNFSERYNLSASLTAWACVDSAPTWLRQTEIVIVVTGIVI